MCDGDRLFRFIHGWASTHRALQQNQPLPLLSPIYDPSLIDRLAAGRSGAERADDQILRASQALPIHCYDWWASKEDAPEAFAPMVELHRELDGVPFPAPSLPIE